MSDGTSISITVNEQDAHRADQELSELLSRLGFVKQDESARHQLHQLHQALNAHGIRFTDLMASYHAHMADPGATRPMRWLGEEEAKALAEQVVFHRPAPDVPLQIVLKQPLAFVVPENLSAADLAQEISRPGPIVRERRSIRALLDETKSRLQGWPEWSVISPFLAKLVQTAVVAIERVQHQAEAEFPREATASQRILSEAEPVTSEPTSPECKYGALYCGQKPDCDCRKGDVSLKPPTDEGFAQPSPKPVHPSTSDGRTCLHSAAYCLSVNECDCPPMNAGRGLGNPGGGHAG